LVLKFGKLKKSVLLLKRAKFGTPLSANAYTFTDSAVYKKAIKTTPDKLSLTEITFLGHLIARVANN